MVDDITGNAARMGDQELYNFKTNRISYRFEHIDQSLLRGGRTGTDRRKSEPTTRRRNDFLIHGAHGGKIIAGLTVTRIFTKNMGCEIYF